MTVFAEPAKPRPGDGKPADPPQRATPLVRSQTGQGAAVFGVGYGVAALLTGSATLFALSGAGPIGPNSGVMLWLVGLSLGLIAILGAMLALRIIRIAGARATPESGARLHLRFVSLFSLAAVTPAIIVAVFLGLTLSRGVDNWFSERVRTVVDSAGGVGRAYVDGAAEATASQVAAMAADLNAASAGLSTDAAGYARYLTAQAERRFFVRAYVVDSAGRLLAAAGDGRAGYQPPTPADFQEAIAAEGSVQLFEDELEVRALWPLKAYSDAFLYVAREVDPGFLARLRLFEQRLAEYRDAEARRAGLQTVFALSYLSTALLVLLGAVWLGLANASRIAAPIGRLAEAAGRVASGDLAARVPAGERRDELDAVARAFNRMTVQLQAQRADLVNARHEAEARSRFIQAVLTGVGAGVIGLDGDGRVTVANRSAAALLGVTGGSLEGRRLLEVAPEFAEVLTPSSGEHRAGPVRVDLNRDTGETHLSVRRSDDADGAGVVLTFDDMTKLIAAQRHEAWKDVARRIAHEIKNPLTPIQLSAERLQRKFGDEIASDRETFERCIATILRQVADIGRMVDEFSTFARMPAPRLGRVQVLPVLRETAFAQRLSYPEVQIDVVTTDADVAVWADERLLAQAVTNLVKNAAESVMARRAAQGDPREGRVTLGLAGDARWVSLEVSDNGLGFPAQDRERLLEPYVTTRAKGMGLGLPIVRRVAEDHGGRLELDDAPAPGPGAVVRFVLPRLVVEGGQAIDLQDREDT